MAPKENDSKGKEEKPPAKVNKWDSSAVKNCLDDCVTEVLTKKFNYIESFALMDGRLLICTIAIAVAIYALIWDYLYPFPQSRPVLIFSVLTYFLMMGVLTLYQTYKEKGIFAVCTQKEGSNKGSIWEASSFMGKYDDIYELHLSNKDSGSGKVREFTSKKSCASYIDVNGIICQDLVEKEVTKLHNMLSSVKPAIKSK
ncbi:hypothetical protein GWI33_002873 [Rhynchophorus ferrugineus]|uniref:Signal peptidase complex subunit 2 n=1 Tax=Rhynchophorus ferrugineus TaxID=354439 RepID=A0A834ML32_RHYFE|nr:hypothetical protein GWI33_002873 [Rhynchophorus ferrugineus]